MKSAFVLGAAILATLTGAGCETATPTAPTSTTSPFAARSGGQWAGEMVLSRVTGGECVGADLVAQRAAGAVVEQGTITITQDNSSIAAVARSSTTGLSCRYEGNASLASLALSASKCEAEEIIVQCSNGNTRAMKLIGSTITASINGSTANGTVATRYNVFAAIAETRTPVAGLEINQQFTATRR